MKLFVDSANLDDICKALESGFVRGITTNPSLLAKEPKSEYLEHMKRIVAIAENYGGTASLSVEVFSDDQAEMIRQAQQFSEELHYDHLAIKIHIGRGSQNNLRVIRKLADMGIAVNCTACMTPMQGLMAAAAGARYVSIFYNRVRDGATETSFEPQRTKMLESGVVEQNDLDPNNVLRELRTLIDDYPSAEIIVGSIRTIVDVKQAGLAGTHIVTVPPKLFAPALHHYKTDQAVEQFFSDFKSWTS